VNRSAWNWINGLGGSRPEQIPREDRLELEETGRALRHPAGRFDSFLVPLPVGRLPGVGKVTEEKLKIQTVADLRKMDLSMLERRFGRYETRLYELARGVDQSEVIPDRPTQSVSAEDTVEQDVPLTEIEPMIRRLAEKTWTASRKELRIARNCGPQTEDKRVQDSQAQPYTRLSSFLLRGIDEHRFLPCGIV